MLGTVGVHRAPTRGAQSNVSQRFDVTSDTDYMYKVYKSILKSNMYNFIYSPFTVMTLQRQDSLSAFLNFVFFFFLFFCCYGICMCFGIYWAFVDSNAGNKSICCNFAIAMRSTSLMIHFLLCKIETLDLFTA